MWFNTWTPPVVLSEARLWRSTVWRMVEAQHLASTMKIVDGPAEQDLLEQLLEGSKPVRPVATERLDYLLATPFRYHPHRTGSRFRSVTDPGVFYAAESVRTASAELGFWRWKFLQDAVDLVQLEPVAHSAFSVPVCTQAVDLRQGSLAVDAAVWMHPLDYRGTQALAQSARQAGLGGIIYQSVRSPEPAWCVALLDPGAFSLPAPEPMMQTWWLAVYQNSVVWRRNHQSFSFHYASVPRADPELSS